MEHPEKAFKFMYSAEEIKYLTRLSGMDDFDEWLREMENAEKRICELLKGQPIDLAWNTCFPYWKKLGRVNDLSRGIRVPMLWPHFSCQLGRAFARHFNQEFRFLIQKMRLHSTDSTEYLCCCDILCWQHEVRDDDRILDELASFNLPMHPILEAEVNHLKEFRNLKNRSFREFLIRDRAYQRGEDYPRVKKYGQREDKR